MPLLLFKSEIHFFICQNSFFSDITGINIHIYILIIHKLDYAPRPPFCAGRKSSSAARALENALLLGHSSVLPKLYETDSLGLSLRPCVHEWALCAGLIGVCQRTLEESPMAPCSPQILEQGQAGRLTEGREQQNAFQQWPVGMQILGDLQRPPRANPELP